MKKYIPIAIAVIVLIFAVMLLGQNRPEALNENTQTDDENPRTGVAEGMQAPAFILPDTQGNMISLSDTEGQVVMINFWRIGCPYCVEEMPDMQDVYDEFKDDGFTILAVNTSDSPKDAAAFIRQNGYSFPVLTEGWSVSELYEVQYIPKTVLVDRDGYVRFVQVGPLTKEEIRRLVQERL